MTARKPLVIIAGQTRQLSAGDTLDVAPAMVHGIVWPSSPFLNDWFLHDDLGVLAQWDGTRWLGLAEWVTLKPFEYATNLTSPFTSTGATVTFPIVGSAMVQLWVINTRVQTTNNASNYWSYTLRAGTNTITTLTTANQAADTVIQTQHDQTDTVYANVGPYINIGVTAKTGNPGALSIDAVTRIRRVYT
jgi:hypothetical protein